MLEEIIREEIKNIIRGKESSVKDESGNWRQNALRTRARKNTENSL